MSSYQEENKLQMLEQLLDMREQAHGPRQRTVGFDVPSTTTNVDSTLDGQTRSPVQPNLSINVAPQRKSSISGSIASSLPADLKNYKSQLPGWVEDSKQIGRTSPSSSPVQNSPLMGFSKQNVIATSPKQSVMLTQPPLQQQQQQQQPQQEQQPQQLQQQQAQPQKPIKEKGKGPQQQQENQQDGNKKPMKEMTRAERRAIQEAQRAAKAEKLGQQPTKNAKQEKPPVIPQKQQSAGTSQSAPVNKQAVPTTQSTAGQEPKPHATQNTSVPNSTTTPAVKKTKKAQPANGVEGSSSRVSASLAHLPRFELYMSSERLHALATDDVHPAILKLGIQYAQGVIMGSNARCVALLEALKKVITDYTTPPDKTFSRDFDAKLKPQIKFIKCCRPLSISMGNAIKEVKYHIHNLEPSMLDREAKQYLVDQIDSFIHERIMFADQVIVNHGVSRINDGDVILTYARSCVVEQMLKKAKDLGKKFSVIVIDSHPHLEGRGLLERLSEHGVACSYALLSGVSHMMMQAHKVLVGAHTMLSNGQVVSRAGTALVAMMAHSYGIPLLVCCETYKFTEKVHLDSFGHNEILALPSDSFSLSNTTSEASQKLSFGAQPSTPGNTCISLMYDQTPMRFVDMVITEVGVIPPTSVPVIIREYRKSVVTL